MDPKSIRSIKKCWQLAEEGNIDLAHQYIDDVLYNENIERASSDDILALAHDPYFDIDAPNAKAIINLKF